MNLFSLRRSAGLTFCMLASMHTFFGFLSVEDSLVSGPAKAYPKISCLPMCLKFVILLRKIEHILRGFRSGIHD